MVTLTKQQQKIHDDAVSWVRNHLHLSPLEKKSLKPFVISGYAGTGKTTLTNQIIKSLHTLGYSTQSAAFTGKAAKVLQSKGVYNARTIHSCIYEPIIQNRRLVGFRLVSDLGVDVFIVDEVSMVSESLMDDIRKVAGLVLCVGDIGQLPPVTKSDDKSFLHNAKIDGLLTEIQRQAEGSDIIKLASKVRETGALPPRSKWYSKLSLDKGIEFATHNVDQVLETQIIVFSNKQRHIVNNMCRAAIHGIPANTPVMGDKIICCKNQYADGGKVLERSNGLIMFLADNPTFEERTFYGPVIKKKRQVAKLRCMTFSAYDEYGDYHENVTCPVDPFEGKYIPEWLPNEVGHYEYGYAITCHRAQGSEWPYVIVYPGNLFAPYDNPLLKHQWLYTAVTRSKDHVIVI